MSSANVEKKAGQAYPPLEEHFEETKQVLEQYLKVVSMEKKNGVSTLLEDETTSNFLILAIQNSKPEIMQKGLDIFTILITNRYNLKVLQEMNEFTQQLKLISGIPDVSSAIQLQVDALLKDVYTKRGVIATQTKSKTVRSMKSGESMRYEVKPQTFRFFINNDVISKRYVREDVTEKLIKIRGVISITFDLTKQDCIVQGRKDMVTSIELGLSLADLGLSVYEVIQSGSSRELIRIKPKAIPIPENEVIDQPLPEYLPESDEDEPVNAGALITQGGTVSKGKKTMLARAKDFLKNSLYW